MHPQVKKLLELQKVDQEIASLTKDIDSLPVEEQKRRRRLEELERTLAERRTQVQKTDLDARALDKAVRSSDEAIKKLNERLNTVRNNAEYQATLFQIEAVRKDRDVTQEEGLKLLEAVEALRPGVAEAEAAVAAERQVFEGFLAEAEQLRSSRAGAIAAVRERRKALAEGVPLDLLGEYEGLFKTRDRQAIAEVVDRYCQGCYNRITPNDEARVRGSSSVVRCGSCQRLLYYPG